MPRRASPSAGQPHPFAGRAGSRARDQHARDLYVIQLGRCAMCAQFVDATLRGRSSDTSAVVDHLRPWRLRPDLAHARTTCSWSAGCAMRSATGSKSGCGRTPRRSAEKLARRARP